MVSRSPQGDPGGSSSLGARISADGEFVSFSSFASTLVDGDTNALFDVFVHDRTTGVTERVSVSSNGEQANDDVHQGAISGDGRYLVFHSLASNLVEDDTNAYSDVFLHDRQTGATSRVSVNYELKERFHVSSGPDISADGHFIGFESWARLVPEDTSTASDVYVHARSVLTQVGVPAHPNPVYFDVANLNFQYQGELALVLVSCTGTSGLTLPDGRILYLTFDACTSVGLGVVPFLSGIVDDAGHVETPTFPFPDVVAGITIYAAVFTLDPSSGAFGGLTDPIWFTTQ
jgi:hypothetical protein